MLRGAIAALLLAVAAPRPALADCGEAGEVCENVCASDPKLKPAKWVEALFWEIASKAGLGEGPTGRDPVTGRELRFAYSDEFAVGFDCKKGRVVPGQGNATTVACPRFDIIVFGSSVCGMAKGRDDVAFWAAHEIAHIVLGHNKEREDEVANNWPVCQGYCRKKEIDCEGMREKLSQEEGPKYMAKYPELFDEHSGISGMERTKLTNKVKKEFDTTYAKKLVKTCIEKLAVSQEHDADKEGCALLVHTGYKPNQVFKHAKDFISYTVENNQDDLHAPLDERQEAAQEFSVACR